MTDRDHFAAAALTGLLAQGDDGSFSEESYVRGAYRWADAMLRERAKTNLDAAPEATANAESVAPQPTAGDRAGNPPSHSGTGDTPKPINDCVSDRSKPINGPDPDSRVWETPVHTPAPHATRGEGSVPRECTEPVAWGVASHFRVLATSISRMDAVDMQSDYAYPTEIVPLYRQAPDFAPPPPDNAAKAPDNAEPVAWAVCAPSDGDWSPCYFHKPHAQRCANAIVGEKNVVPLYRHPPCQDASQKNLTLTDAEREDLQMWLAECLRQCSTATEGANEELAERWQGRAKRAAAMIERLGGVE